MRVKAALLSLVLVVAGLGVFVLTRDSACEKWQDGYRAVTMEFGHRNGPFTPSQVLEETVSRYGPQPTACDVPLDEDGGLIQ